MRSLLFSTYIKDLSKAWITSDTSLFSIVQDIDASTDQEWPEKYKQMGLSMESNV